MRNRERVVLLRSVPFAGAACRCRAHAELCTYAQGVMEHESRALVLLSNDNGLLQDAELAWDVRGSPLRSFPWQVRHCGTRQR